MPRGPRLDAPGVLHHVMVRGIEGRLLFRDDADRQDFVARLATVAPATGLVVLAWALLPNHAHLLVRTGTRPLAEAMARLLTGYAGAFNRRHRRRGRLFQNRYKSIVVEEESYLLELVRYLHLNPFRAGVVPDLQALGTYPWSGHSALLGTVLRSWQTTKEVLGQFGPTVARARRAYGDFVVAGIPQGRRPELQGGGLVRSAGGWAVATALRRGREHGLADERILGSEDFVEAIYRQVAARQPGMPRQRAIALFPELLARCAWGWGVASIEVVAGARRRRAADARAVAGFLGASALGLPLVTLAAALGVTVTAIRAGLRRGPDLLRRAGRTPAELLSGLVREKTEGGRRKQVQ